MVVQYNTSILDHIDGLALELEEDLNTSIYNNNDTKEHIRAIDNILRGEYSVVTNTGIKGDIVCARLRSALTQLELGYQQRLFSEVFIQANLQNIYGDEYKTNEVAIKKKNGVETLPVITFLSLPRRSGKSWGVSRCIAAALVCIPNWSGVVFSPFQRQSDYLMKMVREALDSLRALGFDFEFIQGEDNKETVGLRWGNTKTIFHALPAKEGSTRGITAKCIVLEEMAVMPLTFFKKVPLPLLMVQGSVMIGISSIMDTYNYFSTLLNFNDPRKNIRDSVYTYRFQAACSQCIAKGIAKECTHLNNEIGEWLTSERRELVSAIYAHLGDEETMDQENLGISHDITEAAFDSRLINHLFSKENPPVRSLTSLETDTVFTFIDPTGGGKSDLAICSCIWENGKVIIVGMESMPLRDTDMMCDYTISHLKQLRTLEGCKRAVIVLFIEANIPSFSYTFGKRALQEVERISIPNRKGLECKEYLMHSGGKSTSSANEQNIGVATTNQIKAEMYEFMKQCLANKVIQFHEQMICVYDERNPESSNAIIQSPVVRVKTMLKIQGLEFSIHWMGPANPAFGKFFYSFSGKRAGSNQKDDLWMAFQGCIYDSSQFLNGIEFDQVKRSLGLL